MTCYKEIMGAVKIDRVDLAMGVLQQQQISRPPGH
jgi:hypothetical protein